jgi:hypothetical protein
VNFNVPINQVSFGNVSYCILKEIYKRKNNVPKFFPIGNIGFDVFEEDAEFRNAVIASANGAQASFSRKDPSFKLWHINGSESAISDKRFLMTFHETDRITDAEKNILNQQDLIFVTSQYTKKVFEDGGVKNVVYCPLGFDANHFGFVETPKEDSIKFLLTGKSENRKNTLRILALWAKKFGNDKRYSLLCQINNPFVSPEMQKMQLSQALGGKQHFNISFLPFLPKVTLFNKLLNAIDIDLTGMSACEGFNLPAFHSLALGKWGIFLNAHAHKDYATEENAILVNPSGMRLAEDGQFFRRGELFNQGEWFEFDNDEFISAMELSLTKVGTVNENGLKLKEKFNYEKTVEIMEKEFDRV